MGRVEDELHAVRASFPALVDADEIASRLNELCDGLLNRTDILRRLCRSEVSLLENIIYSARDFFVATEALLTSAIGELESFVTTRDYSLSQRIQDVCVEKSKRKCGDSIKRITESNSHQMQQIEGNY
jgi:hypothetical protein